ncbi:hypothetical protein [Pedobacter cryoconitis]|uniref:Uncharacterized protein n=1 Tax=Pedobacter cryoconitis TaxID=188932 RepID=A0A7X0MJ08_9SPHI|nr:hypothetical protein [Pedobacter cryoconitis]MBB6498963.1 hypothetical protein [Pedobacter cryoconitis]
MSNFYVILDSLNPNWPEDGTPISLTGIKEIIISNLKLNGASIIMQLIAHNFKNTEQEYFTENQKLISIKLEYPRKFDSLFFIKDIIPEGIQASFDLELVSRYQD